jgi:formate dehydrogenase subunit gamma
MAARTVPPERPAPARLNRFGPGARRLHWVNAALFGVLMATAAILYVGSLAALVGRRELVRVVHVAAGLALPVPLVLSLLGRRRHEVRAEVRALSRFDDDDRRWLRSRGRDRTVRMGKYHPGQKLNAAFTLGAILVMLLTGSVMHWFSPFPVDWRTGATFVHDWTAIAVTVVVAGHLRMALSDADAFRAMREGWVPAAWARRHRPKWYEAVTGAASRPPAGRSRDDGAPGVQLREHEQ